MLKNFMTSHVLDNHRNVGNQKTCKPVIVANRLKYVYDVYTRPVGSERVKKIVNFMNFDFCVFNVLQCTSNYVILAPNNFTIDVQFRVSVQSKSRLKATITPSWASLTLSFWTASKYSWKISKFLMLGVNQDSFPKMISGFAQSIIV